MAGYLKLVDAHDDGFRVKLIAPDGTLVAVSTFYASKKDAIAGIEMIREIAGTGPVVDQSRQVLPGEDDVLFGTDAHAVPEAVPEDSESVSSGR